MACASDCSARSRSNRSGSRTCSPRGARAPRQGAIVRDTLEALERKLRAASSGAVDLRVALPGALAGGGLLMFLAGRRRIPEWYDLLFWSFVTFCNLNPPTQADGDDGPR